jgi:hypothetical protein
VHAFAAVDPLGQKLPSEHVASLDGVVQYEPAGHGFCAVDPAGQ